MSTYSSVTRPAILLLQRSLADVLSLYGLTCYMAGKSLTGGELWQEDIRNALLNSRELILLLTPNSMKSPWVMIEAGAAWIQKEDH